MEVWHQSVFICKIKFYEDWVWKLNCKFEFFVSFTGYQNSLDKALIDVLCETYCSFIVKMSYHIHINQLLTYKIRDISLLWIPKVWGL